MLVILMWLIVRLLCEMCFVKRCCSVLIIIDDHDDESFVGYNLQMVVFGEDIIWWCKLYNIELMICALSSPYLKVHAFIVMLSLLVKNVTGGDYYVS